MSRLILQIRGTSGSGKTTAMKRLLELINPKPVKMSPNGKRVRAYRGSYRGYSVVVLGDYTIGAGGCDTIPKIDEVIELVREYSKPKTIVAFEGLLLAHSWGAMGEFAHEKYGEAYVNAFLDTPVETCFARVLQRRAEKGDDTPPERYEKIQRNVYADFHRVELCWNRVQARGGQRLRIPHKRSVQWVQKYLDNWIDSQGVLE